MQVQARPSYKEQYSFWVEGTPSFKNISTARIYALQPNSVHIQQAALGKVSGEATQTSSKMNNSKLIKYLESSSIVKEAYLQVCMHMVAIVMNLHPTWWIRNREGRLINKM